MFIHFEVAIALSLYWVVGTAHPVFAHDRPHHVSHEVPHGHPGLSGSIGRSQAPVLLESHVFKLAGRPLAVNLFDACDLLTRDGHSAVRSTVFRP